MSQRQQLKIIQKTAKQPWLQILVDPVSKSLVEKRLYLEDQRAAHEFPDPPSLLKSTINAMRQAFYQTMLPAGYPASVHPNYIKFNWWSFVQGVAGSASGVLSTQCLLVGLGMAGTSGSGTAIGGGTIALAATLNWILKDGIGNLGGILFVTKFGAKFDRDAKRYRFLSAVAMSLSTVLELLVPLVPHLFLPVASIANTCKSVSWMANSATRAQIQRHFTRLDNLGDLTGKAASLNTAAVVCGTGLGVTLSSVFLASSVTLTPLALVLKCMAISAPLILVYMWANYKSCLLGISPRLTLQRLDLLLRPLATELLDLKGALRKERIGELGRYIRDPSRVGKLERFLYAPWNRNKLASISFEPPAIKLAKILNDETMAEQYSSFFTENNFIAAFDSSGKLCVWFSDEVKLDQIISDMLAIYLARIIYERSNGEIEWLAALSKGKEYSTSVGLALVEALQARHWDISSGSEIDRSPIFIGTSL